MPDLIHPDRTRCSGGDCAWRNSGGREVAPASGPSSVVTKYPRPGYLLGDTERHVALDFTWFVTREGEYPNGIVVAVCLEEAAHTHVIWNVYTQDLGYRWCCEAGDYVYEGGLTEAVKRYTERAGRRRDHVLTVAR